MNKLTYKICSIKIIFKNIEKCASSTLNFSNIACPPPVHDGITKSLLLS